jgi:hypothetical protein
VRSDWNEAVTINRKEMWYFMQHTLRISKLKKNWNELEEF